MVLGVAAVAPFTMPIGGNLRDIRNPEFIGNQIINRDPNISALEAADKIETMSVPNHGEQVGDFVTRLLNGHTKENGKAGL